MVTSRHVFANALKHLFINQNLNFQKFIKSFFNVIKAVTKNLIKTKKNEKI
jgi:hypothetical protein